MLELALREALTLGNDYIGTEHLLLVLIREGNGDFAKLLTSLGTNPKRVRQEVMQLKSSYQGPSNSPTRP